MKRYWMDVETYDGKAAWAHPVKDRDGEWVRYDDAQAEIARLTKERDHGTVIEAQLRVKIDRLTAERDEARAEAAAAYERAAICADGWFLDEFGPPMLERIRALATEPGTTALAEIVKRVREEAFRDGYDRGFGDACLSPGAAPPLSTRVASYLSRIDQRKGAGE